MHAPPKAGESVKLLSRCSGKLTFFRASQIIASAFGFGGHNYVKWSLWTSRMQSFLQFITSLRLTVLCLVMAIVLVFAGTLAQVEVGLWDAQKSYFHSFLVFWRPHGWSMRLPVWPGGYLLGWVLVLNLLAAH